MSDNYEVIIGNGDKKSLGELKSSLISRGFKVTLEFSDSFIVDGAVSIRYSVGEGSFHLSTPSLGVFAEEKFRKNGEWEYLRLNKALLSRWNKIVVASLEILGESSAFGSTSAWITSLHKTVAVYYRGFDYVRQQVKERIKAFSGADLSDSDIMKLVSAATTHEETINGIVCRFFLDANVTDRIFNKLAELVEEKYGRKK